MEPVRNEGTGHGWIAPLTTTASSPYDGTVDSLFKDPWHLWRAHQGSDRYPVKKIVATPPIEPDDDPLARLQDSHSIPCNTLMDVVLRQHCLTGDH